MNERSCPHCGEPVQRSATFCGSCGTPIGEGTGRWWYLGGGVLAGALAAGILSFVIFGVLGEGAEEDEVRHVAERFVMNLITFDYRTIDSDIERILDDAGSSFEDELDVIFGGDIDTFREALREEQIQSSGSVLGSVVQALESDTARVLVVADQRIESDETPEPRTIPRRMELTLVETEDGWKVDRVERRSGLTEPASGVSAPPDPNSTNGELQAVAERFTQNLLTFDYRSLHSDIERLREDATSSFEGELETAFGGDIDAFRESLRDAQSRSSGTVLGSIVQSRETDRAEVLVIADQRIESEETAGPRTISRRIGLTLVRTSDDWKVDRVDASGGLTGGG